MTVDIDLRTSHRFRHRKPAAGKPKPFFHVSTGASTLKSLTAVITISVILACGALNAQETPSNYEHLKHYDQLIGTWVCEVPASKDASETAKESDGTIVHMSCKWILDKNAIEREWRFEGKSGGQVTTKSLTGWDRAEGQIFGVISAGLPSCPAAQSHSVA